MLLILFGLIAAASPPFPLVELFPPEPRCRSRACCICIALLCMNIYIDGLREYAIAANAAKQKPSNAKIIRKHFHIGHIMEKKKHQTGRP